MDDSDLHRGFHCGDSRSHDFDEMTSAGPHDGVYLLLGFQTSRFQSARDPCPQDSRFVESRYADGPFLVGTFPESPDLRHVSG
jgi:hypothetical protein